MQFGSTLALELSVLPTQAVQLCVLSVQVRQRVFAQAWHSLWLGKLSQYPVLGQGQFGNVLELLRPVDP